MRDSTSFRTLTLSNPQTSRLLLVSLSYRFIANLLNKHIVTCEVYCMVELTAFSLKGSLTMMYLSAVYTLSYALLMYSGIKADCVSLKGKPQYLALFSNTFYNLILKYTTRKRRTLRVR